MYSKSYWVACSAGQSDALLSYYDSDVAPAIQSSSYHVGHHMVEVGKDKWLLVSNYKNKAAADEAVEFVKKLIEPMAAKYGLELGVIAEGDVVRTV